MGLILCIETATTNCSVALSENGSVIAFRDDTTAGYSHAEKLHLFIAEVLAEAKLPKEKLDAVAVSKGPGSYTGLRIGVSAAKGICYALDIPLISVPTLTVLAQKVTDAGTVIPLLDARRMEVYSAVFNSEKKQIRDTQADILTDGSYAEYLSEGKTIFIGSGVDKFKTICEHPNADFIENEFPSAKHMGALAEEKFGINEFEDVAYFEPYYLKDFIGG
ncbi:tRNA (adenosine(37)-N6)-threonylcarbamoyltransferase complex dimerization subunit type 1 TsaB [Candidatus Ulvibacter alkanivorans]|uniref:tRNA (adenosine(37)-N6)-threonylcarbamoyltransferase complex dimerization subunit type 1 TsaB n=1 Tax=Candidatus Ulvibacter alkanivorans TaxID=2267620 RepID=UPI000DF12013|nr:tRNA (adenosine(37)-N6)-threonylcarbamoyltransferase complex dimerization subunit type 1 TsaB [Candidatus Ulvibacter alkanivorans]